MGNEALPRFRRMYSEAVKMLPNNSAGVVNSVASHKARLAVVFGVAAMDAYFTQKFLNYLTEYLKAMKGRSKLEGKQNERARAVRAEQDKALEKLLLNAGVTPAFYRDQFGKTKHYRAIHSLVRRHLQSRWTTQRFDRINELFDMYGITSLSQRSLANARQTLNLQGGLKPDKRIEALVSRRNDICHECDMDSHNKLQSINLRDIERDLNVINVFVHAADLLVNEEMK